LMRGIEQVLRSMLVPELRAIKQQVEAMSASLEQRLVFMDRVQADLEEYRFRGKRSRGIPGAPSGSMKKA